MALSKRPRKETFELPSCASSAWCASSPGLKSPYTLRTAGASDNRRIARRDLRLPFRQLSLVGKVLLELGNVGQKLGAAKQ